MEPMAPTEFDFLFDYYTAFSLPQIESSELSAVLSPACRSLWIGSYFGLIDDLPRRPSLIVDIDREALRHASRCLPEIPRVQADIRSLPFDRCFDAILVPGCVSAYLLDESGLARAAGSLLGALEDRPGAALYIDAYDREHIFGTDYFVGERAMTIQGADWLRTASCEQISDRPFVFDVSLSFHCQSGPRVGPIVLRFRQRAFELGELRRAFLCQGVRCSVANGDAGPGRFYLKFTV
jgi:hypothetical protein